MRVSFKLSKQPAEEKDLFLDFHGQTVKSVALNNAPLPPSSVFSGQRVQIKKEMLKATNSIEITFGNKYRNSGTGLHHFKDPDGVRAALANACAEGVPVYAVRAVPRPQGVPLLQPA